MKKRMLSLLCVLALCLGLLPTTALAAAEGAPDTLYVGNQQVIVAETVTYWTTDNSGALTISTESDAWNVKYDPSTATLTLNEATINGAHDATSPPYGSGIYALSRSGQPVSLTIELIGTNTITGNYGIYVDAQQGERVGTNASLTITGNGRLEVSGSSSYGIYVKSGTGNASLTINDASVVASSSSSYDGYAGVYVQSSASATSSPQLSLAVDGGSLTASGGTSGDGIQFHVGAYDATSATTSLTVSENAIVDARTGGIKASRVDEPTPSGTGIVFDGSEGTVYGDVTLDEPLTVGAGETLTVPSGSSLNCNGKLTNNGTITVQSGGTLEGTPTGNGTVEYKVTGVTLDKTELSLYTGESKTLTATVEPANATNQDVTWENSNPDVATVVGGTVTAVKEGEATITVTTVDGGYTATCKVTVTQSTYGISADATALDFGSVYTGYTRPAAQTVTITNTGNQTLNLEQPASTKSFEVGNLSKTQLAPDEKATFTVQPKAGLAAGVYREEIQVSDSGNVTLSIPVSFSVQAAAAPQVTPAPAATPAPSDNITYYTCPSCGYHNWTATEAGYRCDHCGYLESTRQLSGYGNVKGSYTPGSSAAAPAASTIPQTGDESNPVLWTVLLLVSGLALGGLAIAKRKKQQ